MLFNSIPFLIFFPIVVLLYFVIPQKYRWVWLLISSYYFYMSWNAVYGLLLFFSTLITWISGRLSKHYENNEKMKKRVLVLTIVVNLGLLGYFKYFSFMLNTVNSLLSRINSGLSVPVPDILLPVGISFFTFQALGYAIDVYRGKVESEKNFFRYALFVSFFPQLVAGPIERSESLLKQMKTPTRFSYDNLRSGFLMMLGGYFLKLVMADNLAVVVDAVYGDIHRYPGGYLALATVMFAFQIYGDFGGYSLIARGAARIMGFELMDNFESPYMSRSVGEFWRRWHASLGKWFRDYLYIPLGGSRKGTLRKYINVMIVFLLSGLWHGAAWHFVVWGGLNGLFQVIESAAKPGAEKLASRFKIRTGTDSFQILKGFFTFAAVDFAWLFFRADSLRGALDIIKSMVSYSNYWIIFTPEILKTGPDEKQFAVMLLAVFAVLVADYRKIKGFDICKWVMNQQFWFRTLVYITLLCAILLFGAWGGGYSAAGFIYFRF
ncbi:MAG: MBOAT family protein [Lachnospiraceae bacterium]|nr:MBOAT family protein [Lachnospiraceae bacterium]